MLQFRNDIHRVFKQRMGNEVVKTVVYISVFLPLFFFVYLQQAPLQIVILHAWKDHRTRFTLYTFPSYFMLIPMVVCVLFGFFDL